MKCLESEELTNLYLGKLDDDTSLLMFTHMANCDTCSNLYYKIAEENTQDFAVDVSASVMKHIKKSPVSKAKLLAIYAVAAACSFIVLMSGSIDKLMLLPQQIQNESTRLSQKINYSKINQYWEDITYGIQN